MALLDQIKAASLAARKARQTDAAASLSTLLGEIETLAKAGKGEMTDAVVVTVVKKFIKNIDETIKHLNSANVKVRGEDPALDKARDEKRLLESFLPKQLTEDELLALINTMVGEGAKDIGDCMKLLKTNHAGTYDGAVASRLLKTVFA